MPTATSDKIRSQLERLNASTRAATETVRQSVLDKLAKVIEAGRGMEQVLQEALREGMERDAFLELLVLVRSQVEHSAQMVGRALALFEGDPGAPAIESQRHEAERILAWLRDLEARFSAPALPFDASRLPPVPDGPTAEGYVSVSEARARVRAGKSP